MLDWSLVVDGVRALVFAAAHLFGNSVGSGILAVSRSGGGYALDLPATQMRPATQADMRDVIARDGASIVDIITHDGASDAAPQLYLDRSGADQKAILYSSSPIPIADDAKELRVPGLNSPSCLAFSPDFGTLYVHARPGA